MICLWLVSGPAFAAPFCVEEQGVSPACWFHDLRSCREEAAKRNGHCSVNTEEITLSEQAAPFCIIDSGMKPLCAFESNENCDAAARGQDAICFQNVSSGIPDPYRFDRLIQ